MAKAGALLLFPIFISSGMSETNTHLPLGLRVSQTTLESESCKGSLCAGMAFYPVGNPENGTATEFYATFDVPGLPETVDNTITDYIYFNIFFGDSPGGKMNQFVPQLMVGNPLDNSTGPPDYHPLWEPLSTWYIGAQYFFEYFLDDDHPNKPGAATGDLIAVEAGEVVFTKFELRANWTWRLSMGVVGEPDRVSVVDVPQPYMGLVNDTAAQTWSDPTFAGAHVNSCWELYGMRDREHYPSSGSKYDMRITQGDTAHPFDWHTNWSELEIPTCPGAPNTTLSESHTDSHQDVIWTLYWPNETRGYLNYE